MAGKNTRGLSYILHFKVSDNPMQGRIQDFKLGGGAYLKKLRRAEGGAKFFGVFRVKNDDFTPINHDFTPKNHIFPILGEAREIFGVFHVKNHDFTPKKIIFFPILGEAREIFGVFHVKNHDFTPKKNHIFSNFRGGAPGAPPCNV